MTTTPDPRLSADEELTLADGMAEIVTALRNGLTTVPDAEEELRVLLDSLRATPDPEPASPASAEEARALTNAAKLGAIYDHALILARGAAYKHGYAIAVHGSEMRDLDLIAVPWTDEASDVETLVEAIREAVSGRFGEQSDTTRPHGRRSWAIHLNNEHTIGNFKPVLPYIDLSVMHPAAVRREAEEEIAALREALKKIASLYPPPLASQSLAGLKASHEIARAALTQRASRTSGAASE